MERMNLLKETHISMVLSLYWGYAKTRLTKFKGMDKSKFELRLKECEFRFNNREQNLYHILLAEFRERLFN